MPLSGDLIAGKYELLRPIAKGGMGSVWAARHKHLRTDLALKFISPEVAQAPSARARFEREAKAAASLQSPHVVHVQDFGFEDGVPYLVMELLHGEDLARRLDRLGTLPPGELITVIAQATKALRKAHERGIVHRDLKPGNIFLAQVDGEEIAKVVDFGIAKDGSGLLTDDGTRTGEVFGSPSYMSPEQIRSAKYVDARTDVWALGVIAYRALTGRLPFVADTSTGIIAQIIADPFPPPTSLAPHLPSSLDAFFERALAKRAEARFSSVEDLLEGLRGAAAGVVPKAAGVESSAVDRQTIRLSAAAQPWPPAPGEAERSNAAPQPTAITSAQTVHLSADTTGAKPAPARRAAIPAALALALLGAAAVALWLLTTQTPGTSTPSETTPQAAAEAATVAPPAASPALPAVVPAPAPSEAPATAAATSGTPPSPPFAGAKPSSVPTGASGTSPKPSATSSAVAPPATAKSAAAPPAPTATNNKWGL